MRKACLLLWVKEGSERALSNNIEAQHLSGVCVWGVSANHPPAPAAQTNKRQELQPECTFLRAKRPERRPRSTLGLPGTRAVHPRFLGGAFVPWKATSPRSKGLFTFHLTIFQGSEYTYFLCYRPEIKFLVANN